jgi:hypothetical protein
MFSSWYSLNNPYPFYIKAPRLENYSFIGQFQKNRDILPRRPEFEENLRSGSGRIVENYRDIDPSVPGSATHSMGVP